jgi:hypothetical protein
MVNRKRPLAIQVRVTRRERATIRKRAREARAVSLSDYARAMMLGVAWVVNVVPEAKP